MLLMASAGSHREWVVRKLGVAPERVQFVARQTRQQYMETYQRIDICLDTLPFNGGTTSLDALWMGVPVLTRVGRTVVGRAGSSHLRLLGLPEFITRTDEEFVQRAVEWAGDLDRLSALRAALRPRMERSPLMNGKRFAKNMESAYRNMWQAWCHTRG
jgi:predicted O-linked N-acetylglucosamine transferase (SPINDLY family)